MRKPASAFIVPLLFAAASSASAAEMFEAYPRQYALGYVADEVNLRYWFNPAWAVDAGVGFSDSEARAKANDGVTSSKDHADFNTYSLSAAAVRTLRNFEYFDLNLKAGATYSRGKAHSNPEGPGNDSHQTNKSYSLYIGPEVEIKVPYFPRLVVVSSFQASYTVEKTTAKDDDIGGTTTEEDERKTFALHGDDNSLDELFHVGIRYYF